MSRRRTMRDRWHTEVVRTRLVKGACRELLSWLAARHMTDTGMVRVSRATLAAELDVLPQRITDRIVEATAAGLLIRVDGGHNGAVTRYLAALPAVGNGRTDTYSPRKVTAEPIPTERVGNGRADTSKPIPTPALRVSQNDAPIRARTRAHPYEPHSATGTSGGDGTPPPNGARGRVPRMAAAATPRPERDRRDGLGDYFAGRSRLATEVGQGDPLHARARMNGDRKK